MESNAEPVPLIDEDVQKTESDPEKAKPLENLGLCLSGGGYRAMVFHVGSILRLNEAGYLPKLDRISSVSGGSITAGVLGMNWSKLQFNANGVASNLQSVFVDPLLTLASETIDVESVLGGLLLPGSIADKVKHALRKALFDDATLQDLPVRPFFVINASNLQSCALVRFTRAFIWDYRVGKVANPDVELAAAVQASAAFPPVLAPAVLRFKNSDFTPNTGLDLQRPPYTTEMILADGGVYDNMGIETAWKRCATILVSDAGGKTGAEEHPHTDWVRLMVRVGSVVDNQVRSLRKRQLIAAFEAEAKKGTYWGVRTDIARYQLPDALDCPLARTTELADVPTRLKELPKALQHRLMNWGYAVCDAAMRKHLSMGNQPPAAFPFPGGV